MAASVLFSRHIQNYSEAQSLEPHWGYADRVLPCTNDIGSCQYLDSVYHSHDLGMLYSGIIWATFGGIIFAVGIARLMNRASRDTNRTGQDDLPHRDEEPLNAAGRVQRSFRTLCRQWLLPEFARPIFGRVSRLQIVILLVIVGYLSVWSFVGIAYQRWVTPVKKYPGLFNIRSGLGPFSDRVGVLAYALLPFSIMLSSRESLLSLITGIPYQNFNFLHRWLGYIILAQSIIHTVGWTVIEVRLYQPQPKTAVDWIKQLYMIWGVVAQILLLILFVLSLRPVIRITGYEFFRKAHYVMAMLFIGACWGHWEQLKCFLIPALLLWFIDRGARLVRTWLIHYQISDGKMGYLNAQARITHMPDAANGDVVRLDFKFPHDAWSVGQHFYLCFPELSIWQSHPFTPMSLPQYGTGLQNHSYIIRAKKGESNNLAKLARGKTVTQERLDKNEKVSQSSTPVILTGPYGEHIISGLENTVNVLCIAGGTGVTYVLPVLLHLTQQQRVRDRRIDFVWAIRMGSDVEWIQRELDVLTKAVQSHGMRLKIYVTRECCQPESTNATTGFIKDTNFVGSSTSSEDGIQEINKAGQVSIATTQDTVINHTMKRPNLPDIVSDFVGDTIRGSTVVYASGPGSMISDVRQAVAKANSTGKVWKGDSRFDVNLICDNRLEW